MARVPRRPARWRLASALAACAASCISAGVDVGPEHPANPRAQSAALPPVACALVVDPVPLATADEDAAHEGHGDPPAQDVGSDDSHEGHGGAHVHPE